MPLPCTRSCPGQPSDLIKTLFFFSTQLNSTTSCAAAARPLPVLVPSVNCPFLSNKTLSLAVQIPRGDPLRPFLLPSSQLASDRSTKHPYEMHCVAVQYQLHLFCPIACLTTPVS